MVEGLLGRLVFFKQTRLLSEGDKEKHQGVVVTFSLVLLFRVKGHVVDELRRQTPAVLPLPIAITAVKDVECNKVMETHSPLPQASEGSECLRDFPQ